MHRPRLLDLFCGSGGAAMGYYRAGFCIVGVDIVRQKRYPFEFIQADALVFLNLYGAEFDAIHASPPCQAYSCTRSLSSKTHPELIPATRHFLKKTGRPYIIENVPGAPLIDPVVLCGSMFDGLRVYRHRLFESNIPLKAPGPCRHKHCHSPIDVSGTGGLQKTPRKAPGGGLSRKPKNISEARDAMGIPWMTRKELSQAIPPAYTAWLGKQLLAALPPVY